MRSVVRVLYKCFFFFFQAEDGIRDYKVTGVQTCALPIYLFCQMNSANTATVYSTPGVRRVVGLGAKPSSIPDHEIESLQILVRSRAETVPEIGRASCRERV